MSFELSPFALPDGYGESIVPLEDVKAHLRKLEDDEDDLIGVLRDASVDMVERYCGVRLAPCSGLEWKAERLASPIELGVWPVTAINSVAWLDGDGADVAGDADTWRVGVRDRILLKPGQSLPSGAAGGAVVNFDAGFTDHNRPAALVHAVKLFTGHLFKNREAVASGSIGGEIPLGFRYVCGAYRMPVI